MLLKLQKDAQRVITEENKAHVNAYGQYNTRNQQKLRGRQSEIPLLKLSSFTRC